LRLFGDIYADDKYLPFAVRGFFDNGGKRCYIARILGKNSIIANTDIGDLKVRAVGPGIWGNRIFVKIGPGTTLDKDRKSVGFKLQVAYWSRPLEEPFDPFENRDKLPRPSIEEEFDDLSVEKTSSLYFDKRVNNGNSALVELEPLLDSPEKPAESASAQLDKGDDGISIIASDYKGEHQEADKRTGLESLNLDQYRDVAIVYAPNAADDVVKEIVTHCEKNRFRFAVIDAPANQPIATSLDPRSSNDSKYGAFYYPWIVISDPRSGARRKIPPGGSICGIYALTDNTRGVFKAPANEVVRGAIDLEYEIDHGMQENLNPKGVNVIRRFPGRGIRVWGARTLSSDPLWKYVNVRRLFIFIEASIYNSTQWVVFEPNDARLWARVKQTLTLFLRTQWREGALFGDKEEEAFSVAVGRETMTEDDILNGRLIIEVGIAPVRPAEFVIFRVFQKTQEAKS
jgi:phage tail sheath protein FI